MIKASKEKTPENIEASGEYPVKLNTLKRKKNNTTKTEKTPIIIHTNYPPNGILPPGHSFYTYALERLKEYKEGSSNV